jgi:hypothetical protein
MMQEGQTMTTTNDGLHIYDLDPQASALWVVAGPAGYRVDAIDPDHLPDGFRWITAGEWEHLEEQAAI